MNPKDSLLNLGVFYSFAISRAVAGTDNKKFAAAYPPLAEIEMVERARKLRGDLLRTGFDVPNHWLVAPFARDDLANAEHLQGIRLVCDEISAAILRIESATPLQPISETSTTSPAWKKAFSQFEKASKELESTNRKKCWDYVNKNLLDDGESLPKRATWESYIRQYKKAAAGSPATSPRGGRNGRSIRKSDEM